MKIASRLVEPTKEREREREEGYYVKCKQLASKLTY